MSRRLLALRAFSLSLLSIGFILTVPPVAATQPTPVPLTVAAQPAQTFDCVSVTEIPQSQCQELVALYFSTHGSDWFNHTHWLQTPTPCSWYGVTCEACHVTRLNLPANNLVDTLPATLGNLAALQWLDLRGNNLTGPLPITLGNLAAVQQLNLSVNQLTGALPLTLGNLRALQTLDLHSNALTGAVPAELGSLTALQYLDLHSNYLRGRLPAELRHLTSIQHFDLSHNFFDQDILWTPYGRFADFPALTYLDFSANRLAADLPEGLDSLTALTYLDLSHNRFAGELPWELGDLPHLTNLNLADNQLTGPLPVTLGNLTTVQHLDLSANQLTGPLPATLGNLAALHTLDLHTNALTGALPAELGNLTALQYLDLHNNYLRGRLPAELRHLTSIQHFDLSHNFFDQDILWTPYGRFADFPALTYLDFSANRLAADLPEGLDSLTALTYLDLSHNRFAGELPWELGDLPHLTNLNLADNQLTGPIPPPFGNLSALQHLDLSANYLRGPLPPELGQLRAITRLDLHNNLLSGVIPPELGALGAAVAITPTGATPPPGVYIDLAGNHLIGAIPAALGHNAAIMGLQLSGNQLSGLVPASLTDRQYYVLDLNYNQLADADPRWRETQTVPPTALQAVPTGAGVTLTWPLIPYQADGGFYEISYAPTPLGPFTVHGHTFNKWSASYTVPDLAPGATDYFRVRTFTPAHDYRASSEVFNHVYIQHNNLWSDYTPLVCVNCAPPRPRRWLPLIGGAGG